MKKLEIEELVKPLKKMGLTQAAANAGGFRLVIDLEDLKVKINSLQIKLDRIDGTRGGYRYFFLCPSCGRRCRVLFSSMGIFFECNKCSGNIKKTLNRTKNKPNYFFGLALKECRKIDPDYTPKNWLRLTFPERPKYMKRSKYYKHLQKFVNYSRKGDELWLGRINNSKT